MGQIVDDENNAGEQCAKFLMRGVDLNNSSIHKLQRIIDKQNSEDWQNWMLSQLKEIKGPIDEAMEKAIVEWNPFTVFCIRNIDHYDYSVVGISRMDKAWDAHFMQYMSSYQSNKNFDKLRQWALGNYRFPVSYHGLASAIDPDNAVNEEDPLAKWAIMYILDRHPLRKRLNL